MDHEEIKYWLRLATSREWGLIQGWNPPYPNIKGEVVWRVTVSAHDEDNPSRTITDEVTEADMPGYIELMKLSMAIIGASE